LPDENNIKCWFINTKIKIIQKIVLKTAEKMNVNNIKIKNSGRHIVFIEMNTVCGVYNPKNNAFFQVHLPSGDITYKDSIGNIMIDYSTIIETSEGNFWLEKIGSNISCRNGDLLIFLGTKDIQEIATKTFFEPDQDPIIDFYTYTIDKSRCLSIKM
jgi:hypothetical protein